MIRIPAVVGLALVAWTGAAAAYERIVTLSPHGAELVAAAGGEPRLVGVAAFTSFPASAKDLPVIGDAHALDRERILVLEPDLAIVWDSGNRQSDIDWLEGRGIALYRSHPRSLEDIPREIREIGALIGTGTEAETRAARTSATISELHARYASTPPLKVFFQLWNRPPMTLGGRAPTSRALASCGLINLFASVDRDAFSVDSETLMTLNPDLELIPDDIGKLPPLTGAPRSFRFSADALYQPGPRMVDALIGLCAAARNPPDTKGDAQHHKLE